MSFHLQQLMSNGTVVQIEPKLVSAEGKGFQMQVPCYCWDLIKNFTAQDPFLLFTVLVNIYLRDSTAAEKTNLLDRKHYLRFFLYQDEPNELPHSHPYAYGYQRKINDCTYQYHKDQLNACPADYLPCEVNYANRAFFIKVRKTAWQQNVVGPEDFEIAG